MKQTLTRLQIVKKKLTWKQEGFIKLHLRKFGYLQIWSLREAAHILVDRLTPMLKQAPINVLMWLKKKLHTFGKENWQEVRRVFERAGMGAHLIKTSETCQILKQ